MISIIRIALMLIGLAASANGVRIAVKSNFTELKAIIWCLAALPLTISSVLLGVFS